jgi:hypothetical protein
MLSPAPENEDPPISTWERELLYTELARIALWIDLDGDAQAAPARPGRLTDWQRDELSRICATWPENPLRTE